MKKAILFLLEGSDKELAYLKGALAETVSLKGQRLDKMAKMSDYDFNYPEEVTFQLGRMVKFATDYHASDNGGQMNRKMEENQASFRSWLGIEIRQGWEQAKPELRKMMREIWKPTPKADVKIGEES